MTARDIISDLTDLTHPLPEEPAEFEDDDAATGWRAMADEVARERDQYEERLRLWAEHEDDYDPLLDEIAGARGDMLAAEARMRRLIAYGREFTRPRPYRLEDLARAAGMSLSGVRTAYADAEVARLTGARPARRHVVTGPAAPCSCAPPWPGLVVRTTDGDVAVKPAATPGPLACLYQAHCAGCGTPYPGPFRVPQATRQPGPPRQRHPASPEVTSACHGTPAGQ